ncbi:MAG: aminodeoxychorismate/anthranilate synthase component II [Pseudomonadota bacterium]
MILILDNYDSFVETLARYVREAGYATQVVRNDALSTEDIVAVHPAGIVLSPGPYTPSQAGVCRSVPRALPNTPVLGVCLGHLAIAEAYGGSTIPADTPIHGQTSAVRHDGSPLFDGVPSPFRAGRYHALIADIATTKLVACAWSEGGELMAFRHLINPHIGVQFHPESLLTEGGRSIMGNFLSMTGGGDAVD